MDAATEIFKSEYGADTFLKGERVLAMIGDSFEQVTIFAAHRNGTYDVILSDTDEPISDLKRGQIKRMGGVKSRDCGMRLQRSPKGDLMVASVNPTGRAHTSSILPGDCIKEARYQDGEDGSCCQLVTLKSERRCKIQAPAEWRYCSART